MKILRCLWCLCLLVCMTPSFAANLTAVSIDENTDRVLVNCNLRGSFQYQVFTLSNPSRVVLDLSDAQSMKRGMDKATRTGGAELLSKLRFGNPKSNTLRLVFDVDRPMQVVRVAPKRGREKAGLVLELKPKA